MTSIFLPRVRPARPAIRACRRGGRRGPALRGRRVGWGGTWSRGGTLRPAQPGPTLGRARRWGRQFGRRRPNRARSRLRSGSLVVGLGGGTPRGRD